MRSDGNATLGFERSIAGQSVLVTGHTGFTGGWLGLWLERLGCRTTGLALSPSTCPNLFEAAEVTRGLKSVIGDIRDFETVKRTFAEARPTVVFHLAAQPLVSKSFEDPLETLATNVMGTAHVLEAARLTPGVNAVVCITTDKVYADRSWPWGYREVDVLGGKDPYSASKACAELVAASWRSSLSARANGVRIATARGGNIIGGGDWSENRIVPDFVKAMVAGEALTLRNPDAVRPWQHVLALVHGYLALADRLLTASEPPDASWNFGPRNEDAKTVAALIDELAGRWKRPNLSCAPGEFPETSFLHLDSAKARHQLGWSPPLTFADTASLTVDWYRGYFDAPGEARNLTLGQIAAYRRSLALVS